MVTTVDHTQPAPTAEKPRKKAKKYRISWQSLQAMNCSQSTKDAFVESGDAEPSPDTRRLQKVPQAHRAAAEKLLADINAFNEKATGVTLGMTIRAGE